MITHRTGQLLVIAGIIVFLSGCATMRKKEQTLTQPQSSQIAELENQIKQKDAEIDSLRRALSRTTEEKYTSAKSLGSTDNLGVPSVSQIQTALQNAGYNIEVDGKMGQKTRSAIKDFQKANGLGVDGKVGKKTWAALEPYENKQ
ncbi:MAG: peptidoglycan-binding protein [Candidatus Omnitrophica bacterium]|nr:peptidoglycan-binding protein [Candidatus Omnitrophota bacterium]